MDSLEPQVRERAVPIAVKTSQSKATAARRSTSRGRRRGVRREAEPMLRATYVEEPVTLARRADGMPSRNRSESDTLLRPCDDKPAAVADRLCHNEVTVLIECSTTSSRRRKPRRQAAFLPSTGTLEGPFSDACDRTVPRLVRSAFSPLRRAIAARDRSDRTAGAGDGDSRFGRI